VLVSLARVSGVGSVVAGERIEVYAN
jgi:hypothetical protein